MKALLIPADHTQPMTHIETTGSDFRALSTVIGSGSFIERVSIPGMTILNKLVMIVDEEGAYHDLKLNLRASFLYWGEPQPLAWVLRMSPGIVGNALIVREDDEEWVDVEPFDDTLISLKLAPWLQQLGIGVSTS